MDMTRVALVGGLTPLAAVAVVFVLDRRLLQELGQAPVMLGTSAAGALLAGYLLQVMARVLGAERLRYLPWMFYACAAVSVIRGLAPGLEPGLRQGWASPNIAALVAMLQGAAIPAFAMLAIRPHLRPLRPLAPVLLGTAWAAGTVALVVTAAAEQSGPIEVITPEGMITWTGRALAAALTVLSAAAAWRWLRHGGRHPLTPEAWLAACLLFNAAGWAAFLLAERTGSGWWTLSIALGAARFILPAVGQLIGLTSLVRTMEMYERHLERHVAWLLDQQSRPRRPSATDPGEAERRTRALLAAGRIVSVYQPVVHLPTGRVVGVEALARDSADPERPAEQMFAEAYLAGLGADLEFAALRAALDHLPELQETQFLAVNLSPRLLDDPRFLEVLEGVDVDRILLEVTERDAIEDFATLQAVLDPLRQRGLRLAVDDTGAGYAGLRHLVGLRPDVIKLDAELSREIDTDSTRGALTEALVAFAHKVGATFVAEGVETEAQLSTLCDLGVEHAQGFLLRRPGELSQALQPCSAVPPVRG